MRSMKRRLLETTTVLAFWTSDLKPREEIRAQKAPEACNLDLGFHGVYNVFKTGSISLRKIVFKPITGNTR